MDVQTENTDPPPCESQPSGKIRKGFKLFGKRKPGNIFSIRGKGDGNNKSPVIRSKTLDGLSEPSAVDSELEPDKEKAQEASQGEREQAEEEPLGDDGVLAAAPARTSISSASSAKSLSFLSLLRGGRRGVGDRRAQTVCQPTGRQRRGLKGLFGSVKFRSKDKEDKEEAPPSPLLMSSRANSVEIIKEDLTLTPKSHPRSLNSPETESGETLKSLTEQDSAAMSPSKTGLTQVSKTAEHVSPLSTPEPPMVPGDNSLSSLLADISSLLTFDSISGGDILADVEAEWGKASGAASAAATDAASSPASLFSKPAASSCLTPASVKPSPVNISTKTSFQPLASPTKAASASSPASKPSSIITTFTKSSTLTTQSVRLSSDFTPAPESTASVKVTPPPAAAKPSTAPVTLTSFSTPVTSSSPMTANNLPSVSPVVSSSVSRPASGTAAPPTMTSFVSKPTPVATSSSTSDKLPPVTRSPPPIPAAPTQPPPNKLDLTSTFNPQTSNSYKPPLSLFGGESKAVTLPSACAVATKPSPPLASVSKTSTPPVSTTTSASTSIAVSKPTPLDLSKASSSHVPDPSSQARAFPGPASVQTSTPAPTAKPTSPPASSDKMPPTSKPITAPATQVSAASAAPSALGQVPVGQSKAPAASAHIPVSVSKDLPALTQAQVTQSKTTPSPAQLPVSVSKDLPAPTQTQLPPSKSPLPLAQTPVSVSKAPPASALTPASVTADPPAPVSVPISVSKDVPAQIAVPQSKAPSAPVTAPCPVVSPLSTPAPGAAGLHSTGAKPVQPASLKTDEPPNETQTSLHGSSREKKPAQAKSSGLSKIPVVGGGRGVKPPVRDGQHADEELARDPPTPVLEDEKSCFNSHNAGSRDKTSAAEAKSPTSKHSPSEESPQQPKVAASSGRDSKIPVKHGAAASQTPQAKEPPRTKIPVSKVPVRRAGNKPAGPGGGGAQIRK